MESQGILPRSGRRLAGGRSFGHASFERQPPRAHEARAQSLLIAPGEQTPLRYHYHTEQEEVFYIIEGDLHVGTERGEVVVSAGELFAVEPGFLQRTYNPPDATGVIRTLVVGVPAVADSEFPEL